MVESCWDDGPAEDFLLADIVCCCVAVFRGVKPVNDPFPLAKQSGAEFEEDRWREDEASYNPSSSRVE